MNVRELITALSRLDPDLPVVIENTNIEFMPEHAELMHVEVSNEFCYNPDEYALGGRAYDKPSYWGGDSPRGNRPTTPVVLLTQEPPPLPTLEGEVVQAALPPGQGGQP